MAIIGTNNQGDSIIKRPARAVCRRGLLIALLCLAPFVAQAAEDIAQIKVAKGAVLIERGGKRLPAKVGTPVRATDTIITGADGSVGISFVDNSLLSMGPNSELAIDRFAFNSTTHEGTFNTSLRKGTLAVVSGKIAKQSPTAMKVKLPASILGVRGTVFLVRVEG